ncbi:hypothetical protein Tco_0933090 [Tanacetum coccineum]
MKLEMLSGTKQEWLPKVLFRKKELTMMKPLNQEFWCTVVVEDPKPPTDDSEVRPLKEFIIKFTVMNDKNPLTLDFKTLYESTGLDYNQGNYVAHPSLEVVKAELAKIATNKALVLGRNYSSHEQLNSIQQLLAYSLLTGTKVDIGEIIYSDLVTRLTTKSRQKYISYPRFVLCALEVLHGSEYTNEENFGSLPNTPSHSNFTRDPSKVTPYRIDSPMIVVNNLESLVTPVPYSVKKGKKKSQTVSQPKLKIQGPEASGALPQKRKKPKSKMTSLQDTKTLPIEKVPMEDSDKTQSVQTAHPQDIEGFTQPAVIGFYSPLDEGTRRSKPLPEGKPTDAKDLEGNI